MRFLADKISQNIHLDSVEGSHQNTQNMDCDQNGAGGENTAHADIMVFLIRMHHQILLQ